MSTFSKIRDIFGAIVVGIAATIATGPAGGLATMSNFAVIGAIASYAATYYTIVDSRRKRREAAQAADANKKQPELSFPSSTMPRQRVYGTRRVGGLIAYWKTYGAENSKLSAVVVLADHQCQDVLDVYFDDKPLYIAWSTGECQTPSEYRLTDIQLVSERPAAVSGTITLAGIPKSAASLSIIDGRTQVRTGGSDSDSLETVPTPLTIDTDFTHVPPSQTITLVGYNAGRSFSSDQVWASYQRDVGESLVKVRKHLGAPGQVADSTLVSDSGGEWNSYCVLDGQTYIVVEVTWNESKTAAGLPNISAIVEGNNQIYDPRDGQRKYTENAVLCTRDYIQYAFNAANSEFDDDDSISDSADNADESVDVGGAQIARYTANAVLSSSSTRGANLETLLASCAGMATWSSGKWRILSGKYRDPIPAFLLGDGDMVSSATIRTRVPRKDLFNTVRGKFYDDRASNGANLYTFTNYPPYASAAYIAEDNGEEISETIDFEAVTDYRAAHRIAKQLLHRSRQALRITASWNLRAMPLQVGDVVQVILTRYGIGTDPEAPAYFEVLERSYNFPASIELVLQETTPEVYDWDYAEAPFIDPAPNTMLASPTDVAFPKLTAWASATEVGGRPATLEAQADGTTVPYVLVTWPARTVGGEYVVLAWRRLFETGSRLVNSRAGDTEARIFGVSGGDRIHIEGWAVNSLGAKSARFIIQDFLVDPNMPKYAGEVPALSANLLKNAALTVSADRWTSGGYPSLDSVVTFSRFSNIASTISGSPSNCVLQINSSLSGNGAYASALSDLVAVTAGETYCCYADLFSYATDTRVQIDWYDASAAYISSSFGSVVAQNNVTSVNNWNDPAKYGRSTLVAQAPTGAVSARALMVAIGNWTSDPIKYVSVYRPFLGVYPPGATAMPPWDPGGANMVDTGLLVDGAATLVYTSDPVDDWSYYWETYQSSGVYGETRFPAVTIPPTAEIDDDAELRVTVSMLVSVQVPPYTGGNTGGFLSERLAANLYESYSVRSGENVGRIYYCGELYNAQFASAVQFPNERTMNGNLTFSLTTPWLPTLARCPWYANQAAVDQARANIRAKGRRFMALAAPLALLTAGYETTPSGRLITLKRFGTQITVEVIKR